MKKKILFLSPLSPPHYGSAMSSEMCLNILKNSKDFEVKNIKLNYSKDFSDIGKINLNKIRGISKVKKEIKKQVKNFSPELVYFVPATKGLGLIRDYLFAKEVKKYNIPILFHIRSRMIKNQFNNRLYKKTFSGEKAIVLGKQLIIDISDYIPQNKIFILPNAIKNELTENQFNKIEEKRKKNKDFNILFISNMDRTKGWPKLLQACKILKDKGYNFNCNFVGSFQNKNDEVQFNRYIKKNNLQNEVKYLGRKIGKEKNKIFEKSDVLVFPTEYKLETFGRVIVEGMMFGLSVIANSIATIPSIIEDKKTGFLLKKNTPGEIYKKIKILIEDKKLRKEMGEEGRKRFLKEFEVDSYRKKFIKIISKIV